MISGVKSLFQALKKAFTLLRDKDPLVLSSSTAFFATFSLSPIIIILVNVFSFSFKSERISHELFKTLGSTFGQEPAREIETIVNNFISLESNWIITLAGTIFFLFVATTLLGVIKLSIEKIWHIKPKQELKLKHHSRARFTELSLIIFTGLLTLLSIWLDTRFHVTMEFLLVKWPPLATQFLSIVDILFSVVVVSVWFTVIFKILPQADLSWDTAFSGGLLTGVLFTLGKLLLGKILIHARIATIFGASASIALLLLFIFYSAFILYYGAAFTYEYGEAFDNHICANKYANEYEEKIIENTDASSI